MISQICQLLLWPFIFSLTLGRTIFGEFTSVYLGRRVPNVFLFNFCYEVIEQNLRNIHVNFNGVSLALQFLSFTESEKNGD